MRYSAFISYSHADAGWARWLHRSLERYKLPKNLIGRETSFGVLGPKLPPVFRDREELAASADLGATIRRALDEAATLILICSPRAAKSRWVNEEVNTYLQLGRADRIRCLIVEGEPHASDPGQECFPAALLHSEIEPLAADLRRGHDGRAAARLKLIASILEVDYDELRRRELVRRQRRLIAFSAASTVAFLVVAALAIQAIVARNEAVRQRDLARQRTITAERTVSFVKDLFATSNPSEARGRTLTVQEVLGRGAEQVETDLTGEPAVRADLAATLADVYTSLGLYDKADRLVRFSLTLRHNEPDVRVRQLIAAADSRKRLGDVQGAVQAARTAVELARGTKTIDPNGLTRALIALGEAQILTDKPQLAKPVLLEAYRRNLAQHGPTSSEVALALEGLAQVARTEENFQQVKNYLGRALTIRRKNEGPLSPSVSDILLALADAAGRDGNLQLGEKLTRERLAIDEKVLGPDHPDVLNVLNNLGRLLIDQRRYQEAIPYLTRAIRKAGRVKGHSDAAAYYFNLGLAYAGSSRHGPALEAFKRSVSLAEAQEHPALAMAWTEIANLTCRSGDTRRGMETIKKARELLPRLFPEEPWRIGLADVIRGRCLSAGGERAAGAALIKAAAPVLRARWGAETHYGEELRNAWREARLTGQPR